MIKRLICWLFGHKMAKWRYDWIERKFGRRIKKRSYFHQCERCGAKKP